MPGLDGPATLTIWAARHIDFQYSLKVDQTVSVVGEAFGVIDNALSVGQGQIDR